MILMTYEYQREILLVQNTQNHHNTIIQAIHVLLPVDHRTTCRELLQSGRHKVVLIERLTATPFPLPQPYQHFLLISLHVHLKI